MAGLPDLYSRSASEYSILVLYNLMIFEFYIFAKN